MLPPEIDVIFAQMSNSVCSCFCCRWWRLTWKLLYLKLSTRLFAAESWNTQIPTEWPHRTSALSLGRPWCAQSGTTATWRWIWFTRTRRWSSSSANSTTSLGREAALDLFGHGFGDVVWCDGGALKKKAPADQTKTQVVQCLSPMPVDSYGVKWIFTSNDNYGVKRTRTESC